MNLPEIVVEATVQAVVLVGAALVAVWLDRRARRRRDVEEAVLRLDNTWHDLFLLLMHETRDEAALRSSMRPILDLLTEIELKASGYARSRRTRILAAVNNLQAGLHAAEARLHLFEQPAPLATALTIDEHRKELREAAFGSNGRQEPRDLTPWIEAMKEQDGSDEQTTGDAGHPEDQRGRAEPQ